MIPYFMYGNWYVDTPTGQVCFPTDVEAWEYINDY